MNSFKTDLIVVPLADGKRWRLHEGFTYRGKLDGDIIMVRVPMGFVTDFASVPKVFQNIIPAWGKYGKASVVHDYLYKDLNAHSVFDRKAADRIFLQAMLVSGTKPWKAKVMYWAVRLFGSFAWKEQTAGIPIPWERE